MNLKTFWKKYRELILYLIVGGLTTVVSIAVYFVLTTTVLDPQKSVQLQTANVVSWIAAVTFAYVMSRYFVFESKNPNVMREIVSFLGARILTLLMDMGLMFFMVTLGHMNDRISKIIVQIVVVIANYVLSKLVVFRKNELRKNTQSEKQAKE